MTSQFSGLVEKPGLRSAGSMASGSMGSGSFHNATRLGVAENHPFWGMFPPAFSQECLTDAGKTKVLQKGEYLHRKGEQRTSFYVLRDGIVRRTRKDVRENRIHSISFSNGDIVGETNLIKQDVYASDTLAVTNCKLIEYNVATVKALVKKRGLETQLHVAVGAVAWNNLLKGNNVLNDDSNASYYREETDSMGTVQIPKSSYAGIMTHRAMKYMKASGVSLSHYPGLVHALCQVKKACAMANMNLGYLDEEIGTAICHACDEIIEGSFQDAFALDMLQGGGGISTTACANEIIANRATQLLGGELGEYIVKPSVVNMGQSDGVYQTVSRLAIVNDYPALKKNMGHAIHTLYQKAVEFQDVIKMGRTMFQDAAPVTLGREFLAWAKQLEDDWHHAEDCREKLMMCHIGGSMVGTGLGIQDGGTDAFTLEATACLKQVTCYDFLVVADNVKAATDVNCIVCFSSALRRVAVRMSKICNDLRLTSSGPRCGLKEINLPEMQPGSSIMPGKVNPVIPEAMSQVCFQVIGNDTTVALAAEGGQMNSVIYDPVILYSILESMQLLSRAFKMLNKHCLVGITANRERCRQMVEGSVSKLIVCLPVLGFETCSQVAEMALAKNTTVEKVLQEQNLMEKKRMEELFSDKSLLNTQAGLNTFEKAYGAMLEDKDVNGAMLASVRSYSTSGLTSQSTSSQQSPNSKLTVTCDPSSQVQNDKTQMRELTENRTSAFLRQDYKPRKASIVVMHEEEDVGEICVGGKKSKSVNSLAVVLSEVEKDPKFTGLNEDDMAKIRCLATNNIFSILNPDQMLKVKDMMKVMKLEVGMPVYRRGDENVFVYLLHHGVVVARGASLRALNNMDSVADRDVFLYSDCDCIGEACMMTNGFFTEEATERKVGRRMLNCLADVNSVVYKIELDELRSYILSRQPSVAGLALSLAQKTAQVLDRRLGDFRSGSNLTRMDGDLLGNRRIPINVYWGVQTLRAKENFHLTGITTEAFPALQKAFAYVKKACAISNREQNTITDDQARGIIMACDEIIAGKLHKEFVTDMIQGGAGTSLNMNANEVIANRANEIMGDDRKGSYKLVHPNDHVNKSQSTNDSYPTSLHLSIVLSSGELLEKMEQLTAILREKGREFDDVLKMGRTQLQDAVPVTLGQEFFAFARGIEQEISGFKVAVDHQKTSNLGGTAVGTGIAADKDFARLVTKSLSDVSGHQFTKPDDLIEASSNTAGMLRFMSCLKSIAVKVSKMCWDLRFMSSGPRAGINEISIPAILPRVSSVPGKNDPDLPEMVTMCAYRIMGSDIVCTMASHAAQLELNYAEPVMIYNILASIKMLSSALDSLSAHCIIGIVANREHCKYLVDNSVGVVTCLLPYIGYKNCAKAAKTAITENRSITEVLVSEGYLTKDKLSQIMVPEKLVKPGRLAKPKEDNQV